MFFVFFFWNYFIYLWDKAFTFVLVASLLSYAGVRCYKYCPNFIPFLNVELYNINFYLFSVSVFGLPQNAVPKVDGAHYHGNNDFY